MKTQTPYQFFLAHAGYSMGPDETPRQGRARTARELVAAERRAHDAGCTFSWSIDPDNTSADRDDITQDDGDPYALWECIARDANGRTFASLCGIDFGRDIEPWGQPYRRVVEAELAGQLTDCRWFASCPNPATGTTPHPVLGDVPTCDRCRKFATEK